MQQIEIEELRNSFKNNLLKSVLIRVDYTGINKLDGWIEEQLSFLRQYFSSYDRGTNRNARIDLTNFEDIAKTLSIPVSEIKNETVHTFHSWCKEDQAKDDDVSLSITSYYLALNITCHNYRTIDDYLSFVNSLITGLYEKFSFLKVQRIGIRKVGGAPFGNIEDMSSVFKNECYFGYEVDNCPHTPMERDYTDRYIVEDFKMKVNCTRRYKLQNMKGVFKHLTLLDLDGYIDLSCIEKNKYNIKDDSCIIMKTINDHLFEIFYNVTQEKYIKAGGVL